MLVLMEIKGAWLAKLCGVTRQNVYTLEARGQLTKSPTGKYNMHEPLNLNFLKNHGKNLLDIENLVKEKESLVIGQYPKKNKRPRPSKSQDQAALLLKAVSIVIIKTYSEDEAKKIKSEIFKEMQKLV